MHNRSLWHLITVHTSMGYIMLLTAVVLINATMSMPSHSSTLDEIRWQKRLIVAFGAEPTPNTSVFIEHVTAALCDLAERDVDVYLINDSVAKALTTNAKPLDVDSVDKLQLSRKDYALPFEMILIGKDGGTKTQSSTPRDLQRFLDLIDGMPMRRAEAAQQIGKC